MLQASKAVTDRGHIDPAYCNLKKAFDGITHPLLLKNYCSMTYVDARVVALLGSYLLNIQCCISVNGQTSVDYNLTSGVPQGPVLGPHLFSVFINNVSTAIASLSFLLHADEIKVYKIIHSIKHCLVFNHDISSFLRCCTEPGLILNLSKTKVITYSWNTHPF